LCGSKSLRTSNSMVTRYFCFCAWWNATDISVLLGCYWGIIRCLRVDVKYLGGIYVPLWTFVGDLWGFENPGCWLFAFLMLRSLRSQDSQGFKRSPHVYKVQRTITQVFYKVQREIMRYIITHY
jgi:hypothetical protein